MAVLPLGAWASERTAVFSSCMAWKTVFWEEKSGGTFNLSPLPEASRRFSWPPEEVIGARFSLTTEAEPKHPLVTNFLIALRDSRIPDCDLALKLKEAHETRLDKS